MTQAWIITLALGTWLAGVITGACWVYLATRSRVKRHPGDRWQQGYDTGHRVGWYAAGDQIWDDSQRLRDHYYAGTLTVDVGLDYISGFEDASERIQTYWDKVDQIEEKDDEQGTPGAVRPGAGDH